MMNDDAIKTAIDNCDQYGENINAASINLWSPSTGRSCASGGCLTSGWGKGKLESCFSAEFEVWNRELRLRECFLEGRYRFVFLGDTTLWGVVGIFEWGIFFGEPEVWSDACCFVEVGLPPCLSGVLLCPEPATAWWPSFRGWCGVLAICGRNMGEPEIDGDEKLPSGDETFWVWPTLTGDWNSKATHAAGW